MKTKEKQVKELEIEKKIILAVSVIFIFLFVLVTILYISTAHYSIKLQQENTQLRAEIFDLNGGFGFNDSVSQSKEQDYHSSGELFCEHYGGVYSTHGNRIECMIDYKGDDIYPEIKETKDGWKFKNSEEVLDYICGNSDCQIISEDLE